MDFMHLLLHVGGFIAPAVGLAFLLALTGRVFKPKLPQAQGIWLRTAINSVAGIAVLAAGLVVFGRDGKMATYAALVVVAAGLEALLSRR